MPKRGTAAAQNHGEQYEENPAEPAQGLHENQEAVLENVRLRCDHHKNEI
jgi:hypothetical protein